MTMGQFQLTPPLNYDILIYDNLEIFYPLPPSSNYDNKSQNFGVLNITKAAWKRGFSNTNWKFWAIYQHLCLLAHKLNFQLKNYFFLEVWLLELDPLNVIISSLIEIWFQFYPLPPYDFETLNAHNFLWQDLL